MNKNIDDNCIFCKLANGRIPATSIYEDDDFKVILDAAPASRGHAIILPKHMLQIFLSCQMNTVKKYLKLQRSVELQLKTHLIMMG